MFILLHIVLEINKTMLLHCNLKQFKSCLTVISYLLFISEKGTFQFALLLNQCKFLKMPVKV